MTDLQTEAVAEQSRRVLALWNDGCDTWAIANIILIPESAIERQLHAVLAWRRMARGGEPWTPR